MGLKEVLLAKKALVEAEVAEFDSMVEALAVELKASEDKGFDLGIAQAGVPAGDKIYTEADLQAELSPLKAKIADLEVKLQASVDGVQPKIDAAVAQVIADYESSQVDDAAFLAKYKK